MAAAESFAELLSQAIASVDYVLTVISGAFLRSAWAMRELSIARLAAAKTENTTVPLVVEAVELPLLLEGLQSVDFRHDYEAGTDEWKIKEDATLGSSVSLPRWGAIRSSACQSSSNDSSTRIPRLVR